jgi:hypothetical protein
MLSSMLSAAARHARATAIQRRARSHGTFARSIARALSDAGWGY